MVLCGTRSMTLAAEDIQFEELDWVTCTIREQLCRRGKDVREIGVW